MLKQYKHATVKLSIYYYLNLCIVQRLSIHSRVFVGIMIYLCLLLGPILYN
uniref:Uncharacterized protein n=1 Tax=Lepeophtheirus salmonis TaxID=72036 RepID=A0A0K2V6T1_LEPSM